MPVYTAKEKALSKKIPPEVAGGRKENPPVNIPAPGNNNLEWVLMHPDMRVSGGRSFTGVRLIEGNQHRYECIRGKVVTDDEKLKSSLLKIGYILIEEVSKCG